MSEINSLQALHSTCIKEKETLEKQLKDIENWQKEASRYELKELASGVYIYGIKKTTQSSEPLHYLCTNCFDTKRHKSILQRTQQDVFGTHYKCNNCGSEILDYSHSYNPPPETQSYDPFNY